MLFAFHVTRLLYMSRSGLRPSVHLDYRRLDSVGTTEMSSKESELPVEKVSGDVTNGNTSETFGHDEVFDMPNLKIMSPDELQAYMA